MPVNCKISSKWWMHSVTPYKCSSHKVFELCPSWHYVCLAGFDCLLPSLGVQSSERALALIFQSLPTVFGGTVCLARAQLFSSIIRSWFLLAWTSLEREALEISKCHTGFRSAELVTRAGSRRNGCQLWLASLGVLDSIPGVQLHLAVYVLELVT